MAAAAASPASPASAFGAAPDVPRRRVLGFMVMVVGMFMAILDIQIVSASLAEIQAGLSATADEASWVQTSYLIAEVVMIPLSGTLSRMWSTRVLFCLSALGFAASSALCATATTLGEMMTFRAIQGFVGGAMIPTVFATSFILFRGMRRVRMSVLIGLVATMAPTIGPTVGGWLTAKLSWHWLFLINVPIGLLVAAAVWQTMDIDRPDPAVARRFDFIGLGLLAVFLGSMEYVLEEGPRQDWFSDETLRILGLLAVTAGLGFFARVLTNPAPIVDLGAFRDRNFAVGSVMSFVMGIGLYGSVFILPQFLARVRDYNSLEIGETMFVTGLFMLLGGPTAGQMARRVDLRVMQVFGLCIFGTAIWLTGRLSSQSGFWELFLPQALRGFGTSFVMLPTNQIALGTLPPSRVKNAAGLYNLMRNLGGAVGLAVINSLLADRFALHRLHLVEALRFDSPAAVARLDTLAERYGAHGGDAAAQALRQLEMMVQRQAWTLAFNDVLMLIAGAIIAASPLVLLLARPRLEPAAEPA
jgi:DHA2 family multidrug resistance protein